MHPRAPLTVSGPRPSRWSRLCVAVVIAVVVPAAVTTAVPDHERLLNGSWAQHQQGEGWNDRRRGGGSSWNQRKANVEEHQREEGDGATFTSISSATLPPLAADTPADDNAKNISGGRGGTTTQQTHRRQMSRPSGDETLGGGLLKPYTSFARYAWESSRSTEPLPLPLVAHTRGTSSMSIPLITIIGAQKGGTTNLRRNLLTHPLVSGVPNEVHFFDLGPEAYPKFGRWPGDGQERPLRPGVAGFILSEYAMACLQNGKPKPMTIEDEEVAAMSGGVIVESSPRYILSPITPYRMKMVLPHAKFVVVLRDPTDRYFSQLRMVMCKTTHDPDYKSLEEQINAHFHLPGEAEAYLRRGSEAYEPYGSLCRGENATAEDLWDCYRSMEAHNPLHRGLYADQLERWFRVYNRSQILVLDSSDMFADFTMTVARVAEWAGLPEHKFEYTPHRFSGSCDNSSSNGELPDFFAVGGRYEMMLAEEHLFREWYRPHTERLEDLLDRKMKW